MLRIDDRLGSYAIAAGEAWIMSVQMKAMTGNAIIDWSQRKLVQSFYGPGRTLVDQIEGVYSSDASGAYFAFVRDGRFSESLLGQSVQVEIAERLLEGRAIIATGPLTVAPSAAGVVSFGSAIGRVDCRFTLYFTAAGLISLIEQDLLPYGGVPITPGPVITSPAGINSDGTPEVGETLTGIDPVGNGPIVARRWIAGGVTVATTQAYAPTAGGTLRFEADLQGPDGNIATSGSTITVTAPPTLGALMGSGALISGAPSSGTITGKTAGSTLTTTVPGLTITGNSYTFTGTGASGSYTITETLAGATNSPRSTAVTVQAAASSATVTVDPTVQRSGQQYTFTARRTGDVSQAASRTMQVTGSTDYPPGSPASDWPGGAYATATVNFPAGSATASFTITAPVAAQPE